MTTDPTIFGTFSDLLVDLGIDPQPTERDPHGMSASRQIMTALEAVRDFPLERLPEVKAYALPQPDGRSAVLKWEALIAKMRSMMAEPRKHTSTGEDLLSDQFINRDWQRRYEAACLCDEPRCEAYRLSLSPA